MAPGRCTHCGFLCNPDLIGCPEILQPCPKGRVYYCGTLCQMSDKEKHKIRYHLPKKRNERPVCEHFAKGYCAFGTRCRLYHPPKSQNVQIPEAFDNLGGSKTSDSGCGSPGLDSSPNDVMTPPTANGVEVTRAPYDFDEAHMGMFRIHPPSLPKQPQCTMVTRSPSPSRAIPTPNAEVSVKGCEVVVSHENQPENAKACGKLEQQEQNLSSSLEDVPVPLASCSLKNSGQSSILNTSDNEASNIAEQSKSSPSHSDVVEDVIPETNTQDPQVAESSKDTKYDEEFPTLTAALYNSKPKTKPQIEPKREGRKMRKSTKRSEKKSKQIDLELLKPEPQAHEVVKDEPEVQLMSDGNKDAQVETSGSLPDQSNPEPSSDVHERKMTKREKKREERRLQNIFKKIEKQKKREEIAIEEKLSKQKALKQLYIQEKYLECAVECTKLANNQDTKDSFLLCLRRDCYFALGKIKNAIADAKEAVVLSEEKDVDCLLMLFRLQIDAGNVEDAKNTANSLGTSCPAAELKRLQNVEGGLLSIEQSLIAEEWSKALEKIIQLESFCSNFDLLKMFKAESKLHLHIFEEASATLNKFRSSMGSDTYFEYLLSLKSYYLDRWWVTKEPPVLKSLERLKGKNPRFGKLSDRAVHMKNNYFTSQILIKNERIDKAKQLLSASLSLDPNNLAFMADIYCQLGSLQDSDEEKLRDLCHSIKLKETAEAYVERGNVYRSKRKYEEAMSDFENASRINPEFPDLNRFLETTRFLNTNQRGHPTSNRVASRDYYAILGVSQNASDEEIKRAFQAKAKEFHPDKHTLATLDIKQKMEEEMKAVNRAFKVLKDSRQREIYDRKRKRKSASSDIDNDFSEEDYECYSSEEETGTLFTQTFSQLFCKIFVNNYKKSPSPGPSGTSSSVKSGNASKSKMK